MRAWSCELCDSVHTKNPNNCRKCGHHVFRPVYTDELRERSEGNPNIDPIELDYTVGSPRDYDIESSPDLNLDGSIKRREAESNADKPSSIFGRILTWFR